MPKWPKWLKHKKHKHKHDHDEFDLEDKNEVRIERTDADMTTARSTSVYVKGDESPKKLLKLAKDNL